jgi:cobalt/nickel transport system permease protein
MDTVAIDIRARLIAGFLLVLCVVLAAPPRVLNYSLFLGALSACALIIGCPLRRILAALAGVLLFSGMIAATAPLARTQGLSWSQISAAYRTGWPLILAILSKATLSAAIVGTVMGSATSTEVLRGLDALHLPRILVTVVSFMLRFTSLFAAQLRALQQALASRAPTLGRLERAVLYGRLGGNLFVRAVERGEHVHEAMLSRGWSGSLPGATLGSWGIGEAAALVLTALLGASYVLL